MQLFVSAIKGHGSNAFGDETVNAEKTALVPQDLYSVNHSTVRLARRAAKRIRLPPLSLQMRMKLLSLRNLNAVILTWGHIAQVLWDDWVLFDVLESKYCS